MFACKVCAEKEQRIKELKDQIHYLRSMTVPDNSLTVNATDPYGEDFVEPTEEVSPDPQMEEIRQLEVVDQKEATEQLDAMMGGTY